jgi:hypothetical protein
MVTRSGCLLLYQPFDGITALHAVVVAIPASPTGYSVFFGHAGLFPPGTYSFGFSSMECGGSGRLDQPYPGGF